MSDVKDDVVEEEVVEEVKVEAKTESKPIPQTSGANLEEPIMGNISVKKLHYNVSLDDTEEGLLELMERNENIEFTFDANSFLTLKPEVVGQMSFESKRSYYRELDAKEAFERRERQEADEEFMGLEFESLATPTFSAFFEPTAEELEKYPKGQYVFVHKRPEEVASAEKAGYVKLGTVEGTPITPSGDKAYHNMVRMVLPKEKHDRLVKYFGKKSSARIGGNGHKKKTEFIEHFDDDGNVEATTTFDNDVESLRLRRVENK